MPEVLSNTNGVVSEAAFLLQAQTRSRQPVAVLPTLQRPKPKTLKTNYPGLRNIAEAGDAERLKDFVKKTLSPEVSGYAGGTIKLKKILMTARNGNPKYKMPPETDLYLKLADLFGRAFVPNYHPIAKQLDLPLAKKIMLADRVIQNISETRFGYQHRKKVQKVTLAPN